MDTASKTNGIPHPSLTASNVSHSSPLARPSAMPSRWRPRAKAQQFCLLSSPERKRRASARQSALGSSGSLSHRVDFLGLDFVEHTLLAGLGIWIFVLTEVLLCHLVDVCARTFICDFFDLPTDF